jgi:hypothetical protein
MPLTDVPRHGVSPVGFPVPANRQPLSCARFSSQIRFVESYEPGRMPYLAERPGSVDKTPSEQALSRPTRKNAARGDDGGAEWKPCPCRIPNCADWQGGPGLKSNPESQMEIVAPESLHTRIQEIIPPTCYRCAHWITPSSAVPPSMLRGARA